MLQCCFDKLNTQHINRYKVSATEKSGQRQAYQDQRGRRQLREKAWRARWWAWKGDYWSPVGRSVAESIPGRRSWCRYHRSLPQSLISPFLLQFQCEINSPINSCIENGTDSLVWLAAGGWRCVWCTSQFQISAAAETHTVNRILECARSVHGSLFAEYIIIILSGLFVNFLILNK